MNYGIDTIEIIHCNIFNVVSVLNIYHFAFKNRKQYEKLMKFQNEPGKSLKFDYLNLPEVVRNFKS